MSDTDTPPRAGRREWIGLAVLALPTMLATLDISVLFLALPQLSSDLGATASEQLWISDIYGFLIAGFLVTMGTLGDRIGRKKLLLTGAAAFTVASLFAAYSSSPEMLIIFRALMGVSAASIMPSTLAIITSMFKHPKQQGAAIAVWAMALTGGVALGPVVGGLMLQAFWWGSVFLIGVPIMLLLLAIGPAVLPEFKDPNNPGRLDPVSVALSLFAILPFMYGLKQMAEDGFSFGSLLVTLVGVASGVTFVVRQRRLESPLLDLRLFGIPAVGGALLLALLAAAFQGGSEFFVAQFIQLVTGLTPLAAGLYLLIPTFALLITMMLSFGIAQKVRPAYVIGAGCVVAATGMIVLTQVGTTSGLTMLIVALTIIYVGSAPVGPLVSQLVVPVAPPEKAGSASSLATTSGELGVALGIALLGTVGTAVYRNDIQVPPEIAGTAAGDLAGETLPGAVGVAQDLPPDVATSLVNSAKEALTSGMNTAAVISTVAFLGLAILAIATLRKVDPMGPQSLVPPTATNTTDGAEVDAEDGIEDDSVEEKSPAPA